MKHTTGQIRKLVQEDHARNGRPHVGQALEPTTGVVSHKHQDRDVWLVWAVGKRIVFYDEVEDEYGVAIRQSESTGSDAEWVGPLRWACEAARDRNAAEANID